MADLVRLMRNLLWFSVGFFLISGIALWSDFASAQHQLRYCNYNYTNQNDYYAHCQSIEQQCASEEPNNPCTYEQGVCVTLTQGYREVPGCAKFEPGYDPLWAGFDGTCPADGTDGPNIEHTGGPGDSVPPDHCSGPCVVHTDSCTSVTLPDGSTNSTCATSHTGDLCIPGNNQPPAEDPDPADCDAGGQVEGQCLQASDMDSSPNASPAEPGICLGGPGLCNEVPPNPNHTADCTVGANAAICVGEPNQPNSAPHPGPPYPAGQDPAFSTNSSSAAGQTPIDVYGTPGTSDAGPPDGEGNCPTGSTLNGGTCTCTGGGVFNGTACTGGDPGDDEGDGTCDESEPNDPDCAEGRTAEFGVCGENPPLCTGDEIDCAVMHQTWATRCALLGTEEPPGVDLDSDPLEEYGGADALFEDNEEIGPGDLDEGGFLGGGGCPTYPSISVLGRTIEFPSVWCQLSWLGTLLVAIAYFIAARIVYGD